MKELKDEKLKPYVGMPVTYCIGSDRYAQQIVTISKSGHEVQTIDGLLSKPIPEKFTLRKSGFYMKSGRKNGFLLLGKAETYLDPSF